MIDTSSLFLYKAAECLEGAESEAANRRYNNTTNRCYFACFQAALHALTRAGLQPPGTQWSHEAVPAAFDGQLINRRKLYSPDLRGVLDRHHLLRLKADYRQDFVTQAEASRAVRRTQTFVTAVQTGGGERS